MQNRGWNVVNIGQIPYAGTELGITPANRSQIGEQQVIAAEKLAVASATGSKVGYHYEIIGTTVAFGAVPNSSDTVHGVAIKVVPHRYETFFFINTNATDLRQVLEHYKAGDDATKKELATMWPKFVQEGFKSLDRNPDVSTALEAVIGKDVEEVMQDLSNRMGSAAPAGPNW